MTYFGSSLFRAYSNGLSFFDCYEMLPIDEYLDNSVSGEQAYTEGFCDEFETFILCKI
jgi:hypothetical protein